MLLRLHCLAAALMAGLAGVMASGAASAETVMRLSHQLPPAHHIAQLVEQWAAEVERLSGGRIDVQVLGANQAFQPNQNHPAVARGQIEAALVTNFQWGSTIPEMNITAVPYLFTDLERIRRFVGSDAAKLLEAKLLAKGVRNIAWFYTTRQSIFTSATRPLLRIEDFAGVKIRGLNKMVDQGLIAAGAAPSAMPGSEVYQGLQTGVIDAGLTDVSAAYSRKYYEVQKFGTVAPFFTVYFHLYVNPAWWDGLPADQRKAIETASAKAEQDAIPLTEKTAEDAIRELQAKGMTLHLQSPAEAQAFREIMQPPVLEAFARAAPEDGPRLLELMGRL